MPFEQSFHTEPSAGDPCEVTLSTATGGSVSNQLEHLEILPLQELTETNARVEALCLSRASGGSPSHRQTLMRRSINENGITRPIILDKEGSVCAGFEHLAALKDLDVQNIPTVTVANPVTARLVEMSCNRLDIFELAKFVCKLCAEGCEEAGLYVFPENYGKTSAKVAKKNVGKTSRRVAHWINEIGVWSYGTVSSRQIEKLTAIGTATLTPELEAEVRACTNVHQAYILCHASKPPKPPKAQRPVKTFAACAKALKSVAEIIEHIEDLSPEDRKVIESAREIMDRISEANSPAK